ncbi:MAG: hypothetical protein ACRD1C_09050 [Terriglobales bacterium]
MRVRIYLLPVVLTALAAAASAQVVAGGAVGVLANPHEPRQVGRAAAKVAIALPPVPHLLLLWNIVSVGLDRQPGSTGAALGTGLEAWLSPSLRPAQSWGPILLGEVALGRRWGTGLHGYKTVGAGVGWSLGDVVPYLEYRRRTSFHAGRGVDHQVVVGVQYILFG